MIRAQIPFSGSYQYGRLYRNGDSLNESWRYIQRIGTVDNLRRIAELHGVDQKLALGASLKIKQAIELRIGAQGTSYLTKPLLLYYATLNLARAVLLVTMGEIGKSSHGLSFRKGDSLLTCAAKIQEDGMFPRLLEVQKVTSWGSFSEKKATLDNVLRLIPETLREVHLVSNGQRLISAVKVNAYINDDTTLSFYDTGLEESVFEKSWRELFPWFSDEFDYAGPYQLMKKSRLGSIEEVVNFCRERLMRDLSFREDPFWFDLINRSDELLMPRLPAYVLGLYILSNISRYEPELYSEISEPNDLGFAIESFILNAERALPLLVAEFLEGVVYFR